MKISDYITPNSFSVFAAAFVLSSVSYAEDYEFNVPESNWVSWNSESAWTPSGVPGASDNVRISASLSGTGEITLGDFTEVNNITI